MSVFTRRELLAAVPASLRAAATRPNVLYIILDDLGLYDLGCYGSIDIKTPNIDRLAAEGTRFTQAYSGCTVCAPARATLMTGRHMGHSSLRANPGGVPLQASDVTLGDVLSKSGYECAGFGKWGMGDLDTPGVPERHGFSRFYGYYHQVHAHYFYPDYLIDTGRRDMLAANADFRPAPEKPGPVAWDPARPRTFSAYRIFDEMKGFLRARRQKPFFCYAPWTIPHARHEIPASDPAWQMYKDKPWSIRARVHASYVTLADRFAGEVLDILKETGQDRNTLLFFSSDNGAADTYAGELNSAGILNGKKTTLWEGGLRIPLLARYPGVIPAGRTSDLPIYFPDIMPTVAAFTGAKPPAGIDGISLAPELTGKGKLSRDRPMYWEWNEGHFALPYKVKMQACRRGQWKILRHDPARPWELYNLSLDPGEKSNVAAANPALVRDLDAWVRVNRADPPEQIEPSKPAGRQWR
jgi:arylsulfatase A-like enzyme